jgi:hypothetical protein
LAGAFCRRFRDAWRSFKHLSAVKLHDDERYCHCDLTFIVAMRSTLRKLGVLQYLSLFSLVCLCRPPDSFASLATRI